MTPGEWVVLLFLVTTLGILQVLMWFELSGKLDSLRGIKSGKEVTEDSPMPGPFLVTDSEGAVAEEALRQDSQTREAAWRSSGLSTSPTA